MHKIILLIPYFGKFPEWSALFFESIKRNNTIDFYFFTDCDIENYQAPNIKYTKLSFLDYLKLVNRKNNLNFNPSNAYKICDLRPLFGALHNDVIENYDFYGWTDMDILFGDIRSFYNEEILGKYEVFSTHNGRISGHFSLFKNTVKNKLMYKKIYRWQEALAKKEFVGIDEHGLTNAYMLTIFDKINQKFNLHIDNFITRYFSTLKRKKLYFTEQYTTPFTVIPWIDGSINSNQPSTWYYKDGIITNDRDLSRKFIYLHFMNFKNSQWRHDGTKAPWEGKKKIYFVENLNSKNGVVINNQGIFQI
jgi:hypothetical protein